MFPYDDFFQFDMPVNMKHTTIKVLKMNILIFEIVINCDVNLDLFLNVIDTVYNCFITRRSIYFDTKYCMYVFGRSLEHLSDNEVYSTRYTHKRTVRKRH